MRSYTSKAAAPIEFEFDGEKFHTAGQVSLLELAELSKMADAAPDSAEGLGALANFFEAALGKTEYTRFRRHCRDHGTDPDTLMAILADLVEEIGLTPLERLSPSPDGPTATASTYTVVSSSGTVTNLPLTPEREAELRAAVQRAAG